jgi:hypothetical protein
MASVRLPSYLAVTKVSEPASSWQTLAHEIELLTSMLGFDPI